MARSDIFWEDFLYLGNSPKFCAYQAKLEFTKYPAVSEMKFRKEM
jgi:hypothetical protein